VTLTNVKLTVPGGHPASDADVVPPEGLLRYRPREYGTRPAYGFWLRHVTGVTFVNTEVQFDKADGRPAFALDDGTNVSWTQARAERSTGPYDARVSNTAGYRVDGATTAGDPLRVKVVNSTPS
jgi:hypothetical protein